MGWKNVKEHYRIEHIVHVKEDSICIGSGFITDIIVIGADGVMKKRYDDRSNKELQRYQSEMDADPEKLRELVQSQDAFAKSIPVYTYDGHEIIEKFCETPGWPNVTHDGALMYVNLFSTDKAQVVAWAKNNAALGVKMGLEEVKRAEKRLAQCRSCLAVAKADRDKLDAAYPEQGAPIEAIQE